MFGFLNNMSIQAKLLSGLAVIFLISAFSGGLVTTSVMSANSALGVMHDVSEVKNKVDALSVHTKAVHSSISSFLNSGDLGKKKEFEKSQAQTGPMLDELLGVVEDEENLENLKEIKVLLNDWKVNVTDKQLKYMRSPATVDLARLLEASEYNQKILLDIEDRFHNVSTSLMGLVNSESTDLKSVMGVTSMSSILSLVLMIATIAIVSAFIVYLVSRPLRVLVETTKRLVDKDWETQIHGDTRNDEIGDMAKALLQFRDNGIENDKLQSVQEEENTKRLERARVIENMVENFRGSSSEITMALDEAMKQMTDSSVTMNSIANDTSALSESVEEAAKMAGGNVHAVAAATEELTASIQEISLQLNKTNTMVADAKQISSHTVEKMKMLESAANDIGGVIEIISDIAEQTNLLALNATIEAARAGETGKGFAVVASEVKSLASETAKATEQVQSQIERIQGETKEAVDFIGKISSSIDALTESMSSISAAMEEQTSVTQEIGRNVSEASSGTNTVVENIGSVSKATQKTQETSNGVSDIADELSQKSNSLKSSIDDFIKGIQSA